jgi:hypothetical protein
MADAHFKQSVPKAGKQVEIVYDYDTANLPKLMQVNKLTEYYGAVTASTMPRTRSATYVGGAIFASMTMATQPERAETRMVKVERRPSNHSSTSIQLKEAQGVVPKNKNSKQYDHAGEYYEECKKYAFNQDMKEKGPKRLDKSNDSL